MKRTVLTVALAALLLVPGAVLAQDQPAYIWINQIKAQPGQGDALIKMWVEEDSKVFNPLVDSGQALDWGVAMPVVHDGDDPYSHVQWISFAGWAGADAFMGKFMEMQQAKSDEEKTAMAEKWQSAIVAGSHADMINRSVHLGSGSPGTGGYIHIGYYTAKPGKSSEAKKFYDDVAVPVYDQLVADGKIFNYGLHVPGIHRAESWTHMGWYWSADLATRDVVSAAFDASEEARSEDENKAIGERWAETWDPEGHSDEILMVVHHYAGGGGGE